MSDILKKYGVSTGKGNIDLTNRPKYVNPDGRISTVRSKSFGFGQGENKKEVLLPTISDDGAPMSDQEAIEQYKKTGKHLGEFSSVEEANAYANKLHTDQEAMHVGTKGKPNILEKYGVVPPQGPVDKIEQAPGMEVPGTGQTFGMGILGGPVPTQQSEGFLQDTAKMLDYPAGIARTAIAESPQGKLLRSAVGMVQGGEIPPMTEDGLLKALAGEAPKSKEYLEKAGIGEGPKTNLPVFGETSLRDVAGGVLDATLDPTNLIGGAAAKEVGKKIYKGAFKEADKVAAKYRGMPPVSDTLYKYDITGSPQEIVDKTQELLEMLKNKRDAIIKEADDAGVTFSMNRAMKPGKEAIEATKGGLSEIQAKAAEKLEKLVDGQLARGEQIGHPDVIVRKYAPGVTTITPPVKGGKINLMPERAGVITKKRGGAEGVRIDFKPGEATDLKYGGYWKNQPKSYRVGKRGEVIGRTDPATYQQATSDTLRGPDYRFEKTTRTKPTQSEKSFYIKPRPKVIKKGKPIPLFDETKKLAGERIAAKPTKRPPTGSELNQVKHDWQNSIPSKDWQAIGPSGNKLTKKVATGIKNEIERGVDQIGKKDILINLNKEMGTLLNTLGILDKEAAKAARKHAFSEMDAVTAVYSIPMLAAKQAAKAAKTSTFKTKLGKALSNTYGGGGAVSSFGQNLLNMQKEKQK